jgi:hypothetical protein
LRRIAILGLAIAATLAVAAVAVAQYALPKTVLTGKVTPTNAGTKKKPKNGTLTMAFTVNKESNSTADQIVFLIPKNTKLSGKGFRYCPATQINNDGVQSCPKGSKIGSGTATALVGPRQTQFNFTITIFAASKSEISMLLEGNITTALTGVISKAGTPFGQKLTVDIPPQVQQPVPGLYANITSVSAKIGPAKGKPTTKKVKGKKKKFQNYFVGVNGCPKDRVHHMGVRLHFAPNPNPPTLGSDVAQATSMCST